MGGHARRRDTLTLTDHLLAANPDGTSLRGQDRGRVGDRFDLDQGTSRLEVQDDRGPGSSDDDGDGRSRRGRTRYRHGHGGGREGEDGDGDGEGGGGGDDGNLKLSGSDQR